MRRLSPLEDALLLAVGILIIAVILLITVLFPPRVRSDEPTAYAPLPSIDFRRVTEPAVSAPPRRLAPDQVSEGHSTDASRYHRWPGPSIAPGSVPASLPAVSSPILGEATWYRWRVGQAAAGPALRVGAWRGRFVTVCAQTARCVISLPPRLLNDLGLEP